MEMHQGIKTSLTIQGKKYTDIIIKQTGKVRDKNGNPLPDGEYQYVLSYSSQATGAKMQETSFKCSNR